MQSLHESDPSVQSDVALLRPNPVKSHTVQIASRPDLGESAQDSWSSGSVGHSEYAERDRRYAVTGGASCLNIYKPNRRPGCDAGQVCGPLPHHNALALRQCYGGCSGKPVNTGTDESTVCACTCGRGTLGWRQLRTAVLTREQRLQPMKSTPPDPRKLLN